MNKVLGLLCLAVGVAVALFPGFVTGMMPGLTADAALRIAGGLAAAVGVLLASRPASEPDTVRFPVADPAVLADAVRSGSAQGPAASLDSALIAEVAAEMQRGGKIAAIKLLRQRTGWGLKESKDAVDEMERTLRGMRR